MEDNHIKLKTTMSSLCDHSAVHILVKRKIAFVRQGADTAAIQADRYNKQVWSKNSARW